MPMTRKNTPKHEFVFRCSCGFETRVGKKMAQHLIEKCTPSQMEILIKALIRTVGKTRAIEILGKALPMWAHERLEDLCRSPRFNHAFEGYDDDVYVC